jgi:O-antigen ligase
LGRRRLLLAGTLGLVSVLAFMLTYLLLQSTNLALLAFGGVLGIAVVFTEPFVGLIAYFLFLYIRPQDFARAMQGLPIMLALGAVTALLLILHMAVKKRRIVITDAPQNWLMLWLLAAIFLSNMSHMLVDGAIGEVMDFIPILVMYFLITNLVTTERRLKLTINLMLLLTLVLCFSGVMQHLTGFGFGGQESYKGRIQAIGIFNDPNDLAMALVIVLPFVLLKVMDPAPPAHKLFAALAAGGLIYTLILTASRGGLLAFAALAMIMFSRRYGKVPGLAIGGVIMVALMALGPRMATISTEEASAYGRIQAWGLGLDLFEMYPLLGVGAGQYTEYHFRTAHNSFVLGAAELGLFGMLPWVMLIYITMKNANFMSRHLRDARMEDVAIYIDTIRYGLIAYCLSAYFLSRTYSELLFILVGLGAAATAIFVRATGERYVLIERKDFVYSFLWFVGAWLFTKGFLYTAW